MSNIAESLKAHALAPADDGHENNKVPHLDRGPSVDYRDLPIHKARVKFFNDDPAKQFGFVTVLDENDKPKYDAFLSGTILEKAGIYPPLNNGEILYVRHVQKPKGDAVIFVQKRPPVTPVVQPSFVEDSNK